MTFIQFIKRGRKKKIIKCQNKLLKRCPQKRGTCVKLILQSPRKPNSAKRKIVKLKISSTAQYTFGYIPGEGHNLQKFSQVLMRGGIIADLPGVHYTLIRGCYDLKGVVGRMQGRSKYGAPLAAKLKKQARNHVAG